MFAKKKILSLIFLPLFILLFAGCSSPNLSAQSTSGQITSAGDIEAQEVNISSKVPGRIAEVLVQEGATVTKYQPLLKLETTDLEAKKKQAEGALMAAQAVYNKAANGARPQEINLAKGNVEKAEAQLKLLEATYQRLKNLHEAGAYTTQDLEKAETELIAARAQADQARNQLDMALEGARQEDILAAQANVLRAEGALDEINNYLKESLVTSPINGTITSISRHQGELVNTGTLLFIVTDYSDMWVETNLTDSEIVNLEIGQETTIKGHNLSSKGEIMSISKNPDFAIKKSTNELTEDDVITYTVKVKILEPDGFFPGLRVSVSF